MHFKDALCLRLGDCDSMICPGRLSRDSLILHVGNGFFSGSACWDESKLTLPLIPQLTALLDQTGIDFSRRCSLGEAFGSTTADEYRRGVCDLREKTNGGAKTKQESFQASFDFAALVECRTEPAVLSLLRGKPLYGSRGRCAYVARTGSQLRRTSMEIQSRVLEMCGMAGHSMPLSASDPDEELHGTPSDSFEVLVEQFAGAVESATTHNAIIRCVQHLMLLLGMRRTGTHPNPAWFLRRLCGDTLCFSDKRWVEGQAHHLPCGADLLEVTSQCARIFGASKILLFEIDGKYVSSLDAPDASRIPFPSGYPFQPYRNALINKLIDHEVPTIVIDYVVGHNSGGISPTSGALPITEADLLLAASKAMDMVLEIGGFRRVIASLAEKLTDLRSVEPGSYVDGTDEIDRFGQGGGTRRWAGAAPEPLSYCEDVMAQTLARGFSARYSSSNGRTVLSSAHRLVAISLATGIPSDHLLTYRKHITLKNFLTCAAKTIFLCPMPSEDVGGLSLFPVEIAPGYGVERMIKSLLILRNKDYVKRSMKTGSATGVRPFVFGKGKKADEASLGEVVEVIKNSLLKGGWFGIVKDEEALRLLSRTSEAICRYRHTGTVWAVTAELFRAGLNHFRIRDCLKAMGLDGRPFLLDGCPYEDVRPKNIPPATPSAALKVKPEDLANTKRLGRRVAEIFQRRGLAPCLIEYQKSISRLAKTPTCPQINTWAAAYVAMRHALRRGWLLVSRPDSLIAPVTIETALEQLELVVARTKPKMNASGNADPSDQRNRKKDQLRQALVGIFRGVLRPSEAKLLPMPISFAGPSPNTRFVVYSQKGTRQTGRHVDSNFMSFGKGVQPNFVGTEGTGNPKIADYGKALISDDTLLRSVRRLFGDDTSPYDVRHSRVVEGLTYLTKRGLLESGSLLVSLGVLARQLGHGNLTVAPCSYAGIALAILSQPTSPVTAPMLDSGWCKMLKSSIESGGLADKDLRRLHHGIDVKRRYRACRKLLRSRVRGETESGQETPVVVTLDVLPLLREPEQVVLEFPVGSDETALRDCMGDLWTFAKSKRIPVIFSLYRQKNDPWSRERIQDLASRLSGQLLADGLSSSSV